MARIECPRPIFGVMDITHALHGARITPAITDGLEINLTLGPLAIVTYLGDVAAEELGVEAGIVCHVMRQAYGSLGQGKSDGIHLIIDTVGSAPTLGDPHPMGKEGDGRKQIG